jgi:hypothetical protein
VSVTVTDSQGASTTKEVDVQPETTTLTLASQPSGMHVSTSDVSGAAPLNRTVIVGSSQLVTAPNQASGSSYYGFDNWSDGGAQSHTVVVSAPTTLTATLSPRTLSIADKNIVEGTGGTNTVAVPVTLNKASSETVLVDWSTAPGTAGSPSDFTASSGRLTFAPGTVTQNALIPIVTDANPEPQDRFTVTMVNPVKAALSRATATVSIVDDDGNTGPTANAGADFSVNDKAAFSISGSGTDPQNDPLGYHWDQVSGPVAVLHNEDQAKLSVDGVNGPTTLVFRLTVTDTSGQSHTDDVTVTVRAPK